MLGKTRLLAIAMLLAATTAAPADPAPSVTDLVPEDAAFGLVIRNISDLKKKGDKLYADSGLTEQDVPRFSTFFDQMYGWLGISASVDEDAPAAIMLANPKMAGLAELPTGWDIFKLIVAVVPFKDLNTIAGNLNLKANDLKDGKVHDVPEKNFFLRVRGRHLLLGSEAQILDNVFNGKILTAALPKARQKSLTNADILFCVNPEWLGDKWGNFLKEMRTHLGENLSEADRKVADELVETLKTIRFGLGAIRVDDGIGVSLLAILPEKVPESTRKFLASLASRTGISDLKGLPDGPAVFAEGSKSAGAQNASMMKIFANLFQRDVAEAKWLPLPSDRANIFAAFTEVWKQLQGHRIAVYQNADPVKHGLFSAVAILDTADASEFLADMKRLAHLAGIQGLDLTDKRQKDDVAAVEKLILDLGDNDFKVRESASNRLALIGEPALSLIEKALKSEDAEVRRRAKDLKEQIITTAMARRQDLLSKETPWRIRPIFHFDSKPEEHAGRTIDTAHSRLLEKDASAAAALREVFGPDWARVRLVAQGKQVVVLVGYDQRLLDTALANLKDGKPGLAASKSLAAFARQTEVGHQLELHASVATVLELLYAEDLRRGKQAVSASALSSAALAVGPDHLRFDLWLPASELGSILKRPK